MGLVGIQPVFFLGNEKIFPFLLVVTGVGKDAGFGTIIYLAALTGIDPTLYEAIPILMVYPFLQKYFMTGIVLGSVKG